MSASGSKPHYHSYLLRLWLGNEPEGAIWRASLENPQTGERLGFATLERLFAFLQDQTAGITRDEVRLPASESGGVDGNERL